MNGHVILHTNFLIVDFPVDIVRIMVNVRLLRIFALQGATEKYFVPGGFAVTQANSVTVSNLVPCPIISTSMCAVVVARFLYIMDVFFVLR